MRVTIIADASYCSQHKVGGFGYWIACERGKRPGGGPLKGSVPTSVIAEMMAICRALHDGVRMSLIQTGDDVLIQTDCRSAIDALQIVRLAAVSAKTREVIEVFDNIVRKAKIKVSFRHVKGHTNNVEARFAANRACDQRAKTAMRQARKLLQVQA
jgi:ribonuclease HI